MFEWFARYKSKENTVLVITSYEGGEQKECIVVRDSGMAVHIKNTLCNIYGAANVTMASREIDDVPLIISRYMTTGA